MRLQLILLRALVWLCLGLSSMADADVELVVRKKSNIYDEPRSTSPLVTTIEAGVVLLSLDNGERTGRYHRVETPDGFQGFIYGARVLVQRSLDDSLFNLGDCDRHLYFGAPGTSDQLLCRQGYALGYNQQFKIPDWVSYQLSVKSAHTNGGQRKDIFSVDRSVPVQFRSLEEHYDEPVYDRGHMAPSAVIDQTQLANDQTFLYSNMTPQLAHFNRDVKPSDRGAWGIIEDAVSCWVRDTERHHLLVTAGTIVDDPNELMNDQVAIPSQFFKIVLDMQSFESISFLLDHAEKTDHLIDDSIVTIAEIEAVTGLTFFPDMGEAFRAILLAQEASLDDWIIRDRRFGNCVSRKLPDGP